MNQKSRHRLALAVTFVSVASASAYLQGVGFAAPATKQKLPSVATPAEHQALAEWQRDNQEAVALVRLAAARFNPKGQARGILAPPACSFAKGNARLARSIGIQLPSEPRLPEADWTRLHEQAQGLEAEISTLAKKATTYRNKVAHRKIAIGDCIELIGEHVVLPSNSLTSLYSSYDPVRKTNVSHLVSFSFEEAPRLWFDQLQARSLRLMYLREYVEALVAAGNELQIAGS